MKPHLLVIAASVFAAGCSQLATNSNNAGSQGIDESRIRADIQELASDRYQGRLPTTEGETLTLAYLEQQFKAAGLKPGNGDSYLQAVPMVTYTAASDNQLSFGGQAVDLPSQAVMTSYHDTTEIHLNSSELVFVGYGIDAPEYGWNDYEGLDVRGKTVLILVNDPGFSSGDANHFKGSTMTYYGRWDYKFAEAGRKGAKAAFIIHDTEPASYPWSVVENSWTGSRLDLAGSQDPHPEIEGWVDFDLAKSLFAQQGQDLTQWMQKAVKQPTQLALNTKVDAHYRQQVERSVSHNVIATLPGSETPNEVVSYTAHWDHLGMKGDAIYNGALDNASGIAGMLEIARQFAESPTPPKRSVQFIAVTGEEQGLLGSRYYVDNPTFSLSNTLGVFNMDATNVYGAVKELTVIGLGQSQLDDYLAQAAKSQDRTLVRESRPGAGGFFRSDHFSFVKKGVPAIFAGGGNTPKTDELAQYKAQMQQKMKGCYHNTCDVYRPDWNLSGAIEDIDLFYRAGKALANDDRRPGFNQDSEFYSLRPAS